MFMNISADAIVSHVMAVRAANGNRLELIRAINQGREEPLADSAIKARHESIIAKVELALNGGTVKTKKIVGGAKVEKSQTYEPLPAGDARQIAEKMLTVLQGISFPAGTRGRSAGLDTAEDVAAKLAGSSLAQAFLSGL